MFAVAYLCISTISLIILGLDNIKSKHKSLVIACFFAIFAFFITPTIMGNNLDLVRYLNDLNTFRTYRELSGIKNTLNYMYSYPIGGNSGIEISEQSTYGGIPGTLLLMFVFSYLPNKFLLSFVAFIVVYCSIRLMGGVSEQYKNSRKMLVMTGFLFFALLPFMRVVSGFRTYIVASVFSYCVWLELVCKKRNFAFWVIYLLLMLIHPLIAIPVLLLILTNLFVDRKAIMRMLDIVLLFTKFAQDFIVYIISKLVFIPFFSSIFIKSNQYQDQSSFSQIEFIRSLLLFFIIVLTFICSNLWTDTDKKYNEFLLLVFCFTLGSLYNPMVFGRYTTILLFASIPYFCRISKWKDSKCTLSKETRLSQILLFTLIFSLSVLVLVDNLRASLVYVQLGI